MPIQAVRQRCSVHIASYGVDQKPKKEAESIRK